MFRSYDKQCKNTVAHEPHWTQKGFMWTDEEYCRGIAEPNPWRAANPSIGKCIKPELFVEGHKCFRKLQRNQPPFQLYWYCSGCNVFFFANKRDFYAEMRNIKVNQIWPS